MYEYLSELGIADYENINGYSLATERNRDILKIRFNTSKTHRIKKTERFVYPRQQKLITVDSGTHRQVHVTEINPTLRNVMNELDVIVKH